MTASPSPEPPVTTGALKTAGLKARRPAVKPGKGPRLRPLMTWPIVSWCLWEWGSSAFNTVVTTFVFTVYLTSSAFGDPEQTESALSWGLTIAGFCIALMAPITGQRSDRGGRTVYWLGVHTMIVVALCACLFFVHPAPRYLWLGIVLLGVANVFFELASVNYNALLNHLAPQNKIGTVSGVSWGMGYIGGIVLLLILFVGFINPDVTWFGVENKDGYGVRVGMVIAAIWFGLSALPVLVTNSGRRARRQEYAGRGGRFTLRRHAQLEAEPDVTDLPIAPSARRAPRRESLVASYRHLWQTLKSLRRTHPGVLWFLVAAAIFRDGLAGIFTYGGVIAQNTFGFSPSEVIMFAVGASLIAGVVTILGGHLDDRFGPRAVIIASLVTITVAGLAVFVFRHGGKPVFWVLGLSLASCVGPAQSAARSYLARLIPRGREGEIFGLYATTGRAVSFLAPAMYGLFISLGKMMSSSSSTHGTPAGASAWGILGIAVVVLAGLILMLRVPDAHRSLPDRD